MKDTIKMDKPAEEKKPFPRWAIFLIVALVIAVAGGAVFMMYRRRYGGAPMNAPGINASGAGANAGSMPGPTTGANANPTSLNAGGAPPAGVSNVRAAANRV
jgi:predicted permease